MFLWLLIASQTPFKQITLVSNSGWRAGGWESLRTVGSLEGLMGSRLCLGGTSSCKVALCLSGIFDSVSSELFRTVYKYPPVPPTLKQNNTKNPLSLAFPPPHLVSFGSFSPQSLPLQQNFPKALPALPLAKHHSMPAPCWAPTSSLASGVLLGQSPHFLTPLGTFWQLSPLYCLFLFTFRFIDTQKEDKS